MVKLLMLVRQKQNLEQDLIIIKVHTGPKKRNRKISQQRFHELYMQNRHNGIDDWQLKLIEQCETHEQLKQRETFWQHRLKTFDPYGVHEKKEYVYFIISFFRTFRLLGIQFFNHFNFYFVFVSCFILFFFFCSFFTSL